MASTSHWPQQSPIALTKASSLHVPTLSGRVQLDALFEARVTGSFVGDAGHANFELKGTGPKITLDGQQAQLVKIHLHRPSEHDLEHKNHDGEIHLVHRVLQPDPLQRSEYMVVGVVFKEVARGTEPSQFFELWSEQPSSKACSLQLNALFAKPKKWYRYEGSLTTAPYAESVSWLVLAEPIQVPAALLRQLAPAEQRERVPQDLDRRFVLRNFA